MNTNKNPFALLNEEAQEILKLQRSQFERIEKARRQAVAERVSTGKRLLDKILRELCIDFKADYIEVHHGETPDLEVMCRVEGVYFSVVADHDEKSLTSYKSFFRYPPDGEYGHKYASVVKFCVGDIDDIRQHELLIEIVSNNPFIVSPLEFEFSNRAQVVTQVYRAIQYILADKD